MSLADDKRRLKRLLEEKQRRACGMSLATFVQAAWHIIEPNTDLLWAPHLDAMCDELEAISEALVSPKPPDVPPREVFNIPPRYMKSIIVTIMWPAWEWGPFNCPWSRWIFGSHSASLSTDHSVSRRTIIESEWYQSRWGDRVVLSTDQNVKTQFSNTRRGMMFSTSVLGAKIGKGGHRVVLDDPHDPETVLADEQRKKVVRVFKQGFSTRLNDKRRGAIVLVMQRLHDTDLAGHCIALGYRLCCFANPAPPEGQTFVTARGRVITRAPGEILWPEREGVAELAEMRRTLGEYGFAGQYLQQPSPPGGVIFKREWWKFYVVLPAVTTGKMISIDCAFKDNDDSDFVAALVATFAGANTYITEIVKERLSFTGTKSLVMTLRGRHPDATRVLVEDKANGTAIVDDMKSKIAGLVPVEPEGGKIARAWSAAGDVEAGNVYLPEYLDDQGTVMPGREWVPEFVDTCAKFPKVANDDDVDAFSQLMIARRKGFAAILEALKAEHAEMEQAGRERAQRAQSDEPHELPTPAVVASTQTTISVTDAMRVFGR